MFRLTEEHKRMRPEDFPKPEKCPSCNELDSIKRKLKPCNGKCGIWMCRACLGWAISGSKNRVWCCQDCLGVGGNEKEVSVHSMDFRIRPTVTDVRYSRLKKIRLQNLIAS
jgi:hypothetical protein